VWVDQEEDADDVVRPELDDNEAIWHPKHEVGDKVHNEELEVNVQEQIVDYVAVLLLI
jgi:hypothetical protein